MLTPYGIALRKIRLDHGSRLLDLAEALGQSSAYLSAVESGKKPIPPGHVAAVGAAMSLSAHEMMLLQAAADQTAREVRVDRLPADQRQLVAAFARSVDTMSPEDLSFIRKRILKSGCNEVPFRRQRVGLLVPPVKTTMLRQFAEQIRNIFLSPEQVEFPVMDVVEFKLEKLIPGYFLEVGGRDEMGSDEGRVVAGRNSIMLREDVYRAAWSRDGRARFTASHELAHFLMHREVVMARQREPHHKIYCDAEWQADELAGGLLMSSRHAKSFADADDAARRCGMSAEAARVMMSKHRKEAQM